MIAVCDGFVSKTTVADAKPFVMGQLIDIDEAELTVTVSMEPTASVEIILRKPDGSPLESGSVSASPNMRLFKGGSTLLGQAFNSIERVHNQLLPPQQWKPTYRRALDLPFLNCPVVNGRATLHGIPVDVTGGDSVFLQHDEFEFPTPIGDDRARVRFQLNPSKPTQLTVTVVPHDQTLTERALHDLQGAPQGFGGLLRKAVDTVGGK